MMVSLISESFESLPRGRPASLSLVQRILAAAFKASRVVSVPSGVSTRIWSYKRCSESNTGRKNDHASGDTLRRIENLIGSEHDDTLKGNGYENRLEVCRFYRLGAVNILRRLTLYPFSAIVEENYIHNSDGTKQPGAESFIKSRQRPPLQPLIK